MGSARACGQTVEQASKDHALSCRFQSQEVPASQLMLPFNRDMLDYVEHRCWTTTVGCDAGVLAAGDPADAANAILGGLLLAVLGRDDRR
jgi:hypothetical protein